MTEVVSDIQCRKAQFVKILYEARTWLGGLVWAISEVHLITRLTPYRIVYAFVNIQCYVCIFNTVHKCLVVCLSAKLIVERYVAEYATIVHIQSEAARAFRHGIATNHLVFCTPFGCCLSVFSKIKLVSGSRIDTQ